jgi:hypothetical protein
VKYPFICIYLVSAAFLTYSAEYGCFVVIIYQRITSNCDKLLGSKGVKTSNICGITV